MADTMEAPSRRDNRDAALRAMYDELHQKHLFPFWATSTGVEHDEIKQLMVGKRAEPHL